MVLAKYPSPGRVKTRLAASIGAGAACRLYRACVLDLAARLRRSRFEVWWAYAPRGAGFSALVRSRRCFPQPHGDIGVRMAHAIRVLWRRGLSPIVVLGADAPHVSLVEVQRAVTALRAGADVVLGPAEDGGYYLIGVCEPVAGLFRAMPWSSGRVLARTEARCRVLGLRAVRLRTDFDVDDAKDLERLRAVAARHPRRLPRTHRALGRIAPAGISPRT